MDNVRRMLSRNAKIFRTRQATSDLLAFIQRAPEATKSRLLADGTTFVDAFSKSGGRFSFPADQDRHGGVLLAAALPDDDFPAFLLATAVLLADLLQNDSAPDNLFWNWEAFHAQYALADPAPRAALCNGFRALQQSGRVDFDPVPEDALCLSRDMLTVLNDLDDGAIKSAIEQYATAQSSGRLLGEPERMSNAERAGLRYLYERPEGIAPPEPTTAPLLLWPG